MGDHGHEYAFTMADGSVRYEVVSCRADVFAFRSMHGAVSARPVALDEVQEDGTVVRRPGFEGGGS